jgi:hypothetical protein
MRSAKRKRVKRGYAMTFVDWFQVGFIVVIVSGFGWVALKKD